MSRVPCAIAAVVVVLTLGELTWAADRVRFSIEVDAVKSARGRTTPWADTLGFDAKGQINADLPEHAHRASIVERTVRFPSPTVHTTEGMANGRAAVDANRQDALRVRLSFTHTAEIPSAAVADDSASGRHEALSALLTSLPPTSTASVQLLSLLLDIEADGEAQLASNLGEGGAALLNASVRLCAGAHEWNHESCPAPGIHLAACAAHRDDNDAIFTTPAVEREYDAGFRVGAFGRAVSDLASAWPLEYAWTPPEARDVSHRCPVRDTSCGATPLYRRMATTPLSAPPRRLRTRRDFTEPHCFVGQTLSHFIPCSNNLHRLLAAAMPPTAALHAVDVEADLNDFADLDSDAGQQAPSQALLKHAKQLLFRPLAATMRTVDAVPGQAPFANRKGLETGGSAWERMSHADRVAWSRRTVDEHTLIIEASEALVAKPESLAVALDVSRGISDAGCVQLSATVVVDAIFTSHAEVSAFQDALIGGLVQSPPVNSAPPPVDMEVRVGNTLRCEPLQGDGCDAGAVLRAMQPVLAASFPAEHRGSAAPIEVTAIPSSPDQGTGFRVESLVESRGERRARLRTRLSLALSPVPELAVDRVASATGGTDDNLAPVVGSIDVSIRWPMLLFVPNLRTARLVRVAVPDASDSGTAPSGNEDEAPRFFSEFGSLAHPCLGDPVLAASRTSEPTGVQHTHFHVPVVMSEQCNAALVSAGGAAAPSDAEPQAPVVVEVDLLVDAAYAHLHADEYAPDMNRYYTMPNVVARHVAQVRPLEPRLRTACLAYRHHRTVAGVAAQASPLSLHRTVGPWFTRNLDAIRDGSTIGTTALRALLAARGWREGSKVATMTEWAVSSHGGLATSPPIPDRAMPFNALAFWGTVVALVIMNTFNITLRGGLPNAVNDQSECEALLAEVAAEDREEAAAVASAAASAVSSASTKAKTS